MRSPATFHFHVAFESGSEPVDPRSSQLPRKAYMGGGGGDRHQPMFDRITTYSTLPNKKAAPVLLLNKGGLSCRVDRQLYTLIRNQYFAYCGSDVLLSLAVFRVLQELLQLSAHGFTI